MAATGRIGFDEAFKRCEQKRPIVYPNVGFQQQLRYLERVLSSPALASDAPWEERTRELRKVLPSGSLTDPQAPLNIMDEIGPSRKGRVVEGAVYF